jgi:hypothetical protein
MSSTGKQVFHLIMFLFSVSMTIYFAHYIYVLVVVEPQANADAEAEYQAEIDAIDLEYCTENPDDGSGYYSRHCDRFGGA